MRTNIMNTMLSSTMLRAAAESSAAAGAADESGSTADEANAAGAAAETNGLVTPLFDKEKVTAIKKALGGDRVYFESKDGETAFEQAEKHLTAAAGATDTFYGVPYFVQNPDSSPLDKASSVVIMTLGTRQKGSNGYKAIIVTQIPTYEDFLANPEAKEFVTKLIQREAADVQFSAGVRAAETLTQLENSVNGMPITVESIIQTQRESGGGLDTDAFDEMWSAFRTGFVKAKNPKLFEILPSKAIVLKAFRSKSYAESDPKTKAIEGAGMFKRMLEIMIQLAPTFKDKDGKDAPQDTTAMQEWLDNRDSLVINYTVETIAAVDDLATIQF